MNYPTIAAGSTFAICSTLPATYTQAGYAALTFTVVRGVRSVGEVGTQWQTTTRNDIGLSYSYTKRVGKAAATLQLEMLRITDAGQTMLRAAVDAATSYAYRIVSSDGNTQYFTAAAISRTQAPITSASLNSTNMTLAIDSLIIEV